MKVKSLAPAVSLLLAFAAALASAAPEPKVTALVESAHSAKRPDACAVTMEVRDPETNAVLAAPIFAVLPGVVSTSTTEDDKKISKVTITASATKGCAGGTYAVTVTEAGKVRYEKHGDLKAKS